MKKETLLLVVVALAAGILIGVIVTNAKKDASPQVVSTNPAAVAAPIVNHQQQITLLEGIVAQDPNNREAWVRLGHNFFDSKQSLKAIEAYSKALELDDNDPNILTDLGIMFRRVGWYDKAIASFEKASSLDPTHMQSLYNLGIVYINDLNDVGKGAQAWERFIAVNPGSPGAAKVRAELEQLLRQPGFPQQKQ